MRILLVGKLPPAMSAAFEQVGALVESVPDMAAAVARVSSAAGASPAVAVVGVVTSSEVRVAAEHLTALPGLRFVGRAAAGTDNIDHAAAKRLEIAVLSVPMATAPCAAELTMGHIVSLLRRVPEVAKRLQEGYWGKDMLGEEVGGKILGIVGLGRVGSRVAKLAQAFGMRVLACDPYIKAARFAQFGTRRRTLDQLLSEADVVTLHTPLNDETRGFIGAAQLARIRPGGWLINCARGGLVDEAALLAALESRALTGAAIDTWIGEPTPNRALVEHARVLGSAHIGAATTQAKARLVSMMVREVQTFVKRKAIA